MQAPETVSDDIYFVISKVVELNSAERFNKLTRRCTPCYEIKNNGNYYSTNSDHEFFECIINQYNHALEQIISEKNRPYWSETKTDNAGFDVSENLEYALDRVNQLGQPAFEIWREYMDVCGTCGGEHTRREYLTCMDEKINGALEYTIQEIKKYNWNPS